MNAQKPASVTLPLSYILPGAIFFFVANLLFVVWSGSFQNMYFREPHVLAFTHIITLGWITMVMFGAMLQIVPVLLEVKLFSGMLGYIQLFLYLAGAAGLVFSFAVMKIDSLAMIFAGLVAASVILFITNMAATLAKVKKWDYISYHLVASLIYLAATILAGVLAISGFGRETSLNQFAFMKAHAHLAFLGWITVTVFGVSYRLVPMFSLSHGFNETAGKLSFILWNIGIILLFAGLLAGGVQPLLGISAFIILAGILLHAIQTGIIFSKRGRKKIDVGLRYVIAAVIVLFIVAILGTAFALGFGEDNFHLAYSYGYLALMGWASFYVVGQLLKIAPFLAWHRKYSSKMGIEKVPLMKDMLNEKLAEVQFWTMVPGVAGVAIGLGLGAGWITMIFGCVVLFSSGLFVYCMLDSLRR